MISIIMGTRPEIVKVSPVIRACIAHNVPYTLLHTGQHYSYEMDRIFFEELSLPVPDHHLDVGSGMHAEQTGAIMAGIEKIYHEFRPDITLVQGDTNTVLAGSLTAAKMHIPVGHIEAGLRSYDRSMPEEINRIVTDHISEFLFAPTETSSKNLISEGISESNIFITGNTVVDALVQNQKFAREKTSILQNLDLVPDQYLLVTAHRAENVDDPLRLQGIISGITEVSEAYDLPVIFPMHPRTRKMMQEFEIPYGHLTIIPPVGYLDFLQLETYARLILTDSGGVQEEACILQVPCITLRENTERPETVDIGANTLAGSASERIYSAAETMIRASRTWENPYGDGRAGERIIDICESDPHPIKSEQE
ncbi:MAG: UDP-N-acetylglucosamine 2-epimerase (non-hydrolyzing) [Methanobacteriota archaeon]